MKPNFIIGRTCSLDEENLDQIGRLVRRLSYAKDESFLSRQKKINQLFQQIKDLISAAFSAGLNEGYKMGVDAEQEGKED